MRHLTFENGPFIRKVWKNAPLSEQDILIWYKTWLNFLKPLHWLSVNNCMIVSWSHSNSPNSFTASLYYRRKVYIVTESIIYLILAVIYCFTYLNSF